MLFDAARVAAPTPALLMPATYGPDAQAVQQGGRQAAWFVRAAFGEGVLRHYQRGGMVARISRDRYVWRGEDATRAFAEFRVMQHLAGLGLAVPVPLAAGYWRSGLTYRAALLTARIEQARPLAQALDATRVAPVAAAIVAMHRAGAWHADLNAFNILFDAGQRVWLIDFDRATLGVISPSARRANITRLQRSLLKVAGAEGQAFGVSLAEAYEQIWKA